MKCSFGISDFLTDISSLSHSVVFLYFFALITEEILNFLFTKTYTANIISHVEIRKLLLLLLSCFRRVQLLATPWTAALPGSSVHGIFQARVLEWVAIPMMRSKTRTKVSVCAEDKGY